MGVQPRLTAGVSLEGHSHWKVVGGRPRQDSVRSPFTIDPMRLICREGGGVAPLVKPGTTGEARKVLIPKSADAGLARVGG